MKKGNVTISISGGVTHHVFAVSRPNGSYPVNTGWAVYKMSHENSPELDGKQIYDFIQPDSLDNTYDFYGRDGNDSVEYYYHGRFCETNLIEFHHKIDKAWEKKKIASKFGL